MTLALDGMRLEARNDLPLRAKVKRAERRREIKAAALIVPLLLFLAVTFIVPISELLLRSVHDPEVQRILPNAARAMQDWDGAYPPAASLVGVLVDDLLAAKENKKLAKVAKRLNGSIAGFRSLLLKTARHLSTVERPVSLEDLIGIDRRWRERRYWTAIKQASPAYTVQYLLASIDRELNEDGDIIRAPDLNAIYLTLLQRTLWVSFCVTAFCLLLGYPIAYLLAGLPTKHSNVLLLLLLLPFWTSLLVRTTAWIVLLQNEGVVNDLAQFLGLWDEPVQLIRNRAGVLIAMTHILLPFMVLPIFSVMKGVPANHMRAAASLGAKPLTAFIRVYLPQTIPGVGAGVLLVFIMSLGYYVTPALVGGPSDQMLSYFIAFYANTTVNWGMAAALSVMLLACVAVFFGLYSRLVRLDRLRVS